MIAIRKVTKRYGGVAALSDCDLEIAAPGIYGLIGPNGAGKTTLFDVITGLTEPDSGSVLVDGPSLPRSAAALRRRAWQGLELGLHLNLTQAVGAVSRVRPLPTNSKRKAAVPSESCATKIGCTTTPGTTSKASVKTSVRPVVTPSRSASPA